MVGLTMLKVVTLALLVTLCEGQSQDATKTPGAFGMGVVNTVISRIRSKCIFSEDRLFLRRTAYVMSRDGHDSRTYRQGFDGGLWQITEPMFKATLGCTIRSACGNISNELGIDWSSVQWSDLRKPLYSGLAAALLTLQTLGTSQMPGDIPSQAALWAKMYGESSGTTFSNNAANAPMFQCRDKLDLAFVLDSSGSVSYNDYKLMKNFTASVVDAMNVAPDAIRIADVIYASSVKVAFDFDDHSTKAAVKASLLSAIKINSGTNTAGGLDKARELFASPQYGTRSDAKKVAVLVTDGWSNSFPATKSSAQKLKDAGVTVFAIGVGNYRPSELRVAASEPVCSHVLTLTGFDKIDSIITEIQKSACEANYQATGNKPVEGDIPKGGSEKTITTPTPGPDDTIEAKVSCGILHVYASLTDPKPGPAVFDDVYTATPDKTAVVRVVDKLSQGTPVYITVRGTRLPQSLAALHNCSDYKWSLGPAPKKTVKVICVENGKKRPCKDDDITEAGFCSKSSGLTYPVDNPCTKENLDNGVMRFSYPYDPFKFLQCDKQGNYYITLCPGGVTFNEQTKECGFTSPGASPPAGTQESNSGGGNGNGNGSGGVTGSGTVTNPTLVPVTSAPSTGIASKCSSQALAKNQYFHPFDSDKTKFVQCDTWGKAYIMTCTAGTQWSQTSYTCVHAASAVRRTTHTKGTTTSTIPPTTAPASGAAPSPCVHGQLYPIHCEPTKFHLCNHGVPIVRDCPGGLVFRGNLCNWPLVPGKITKPAGCP